MAWPSYRKGQVRCSITEASAKEFYDSGQVGTEYKARHILVEEETKAQELITELDVGAEFAALA